MESADQADCILYNLVIAEDEVCILETYLQPNSYIHYYMDPLLRSWVSNVITSVLATTDQRTRSVLLQEIENRLIDEAQAHFLFHRSLQTYVHPSIRGLDINKLGFIDFKDIWFTPTFSTS